MTLADLLLSCVHENVLNMWVIDFSRPMLNAGRECSMPEVD